MVSMEGAQTTNTRSSRCETIRGWSVKVVGRPGENTYDERGELFFIRRGEVHHSIENLDAGVGVDIDAALVWRTGNERMRGG